MSKEADDARLAAGEWIGIACAVVLVVSLFAFPWFGYSIEDEVVPGSDGDAFRWLHGLDGVLLAAGIVALGTALLRLAGPVGPGILLGGLIAGLVAANLTVALMISPPKGGEAVFGTFGGNPAGELVPQRGALLGLAAAIGVVVTGWLRIVKRTEEVAELQAAHAPPVPAERTSAVAPPAAVAPLTASAPVAAAAAVKRKPAAKPKAAAKSKPAAKPKPKAGAAPKTKAAAKASKRKPAAKPKSTTPKRRPPSKP